MEFDLFDFVRRYFFYVAYVMFQKCFGVLPLNSLNLPKYDRPKGLFVCHQTDTNPPSTYQKYFGSNIPGFRLNLNMHRHDHMPRKQDQDEPILQSREHRCQVLKIVHIEIALLCRS